MNLSLRTFAQTVSAMAASAQAAAAQALDFSTGSVLLAMSQAVAGVSLWLQWVSALVLQATRLTTSVGTDCDTFGADFGFTRLPAVASTGAVTFARYVPTNSATIPCGFPGLPVTVVKTVDGTQSFSVVADTTQSAYVADTTGLTAGNYVIPAGVSSCTATVQAIAPGTGGNVLANTIGLMATSVAGVDTVTNGAALSNGANAETDEAFKVRFGLFLPSLARGTPDAVRSLALAQIFEEATVAQVPEPTVTLPASVPDELVLMIAYADAQTG